MRSVVAVGLALATVASLSGPVNAKAATQGKVLWRGDFQNGSTKQWSQVQEVRKSSIVVTKKVHAPGSRYSARFRVLKGDDELTRPGYVRAEVMEDVQHTGGTSGHTRWYGWRTMLPKGFDAAPSPCYLMLTQWHALAAASPNVVLEYSHWSGEARTLAFFVEGGTINSAGQASSMQTFPLQKPRIHHWYKFEVGVHWSSSAQRGWVQLWVDGRRVVSTHIATLYKGDQAYLKQGAYGTASPTPITVYHSGMRIGTTRASVKP